MRGHLMMDGRMDADFVLVSFRSRIAVPRVKKLIGRLINHVRPHLLHILDTISRYLTECLDFKQQKETVRAVMRGKPIPTNAQGQKTLIASTDFFLSEGGKVVNRSEFHS